MPSFSQGFLPVRTEQVAGSEASTFPSCYLGKGPKGDACVLESPSDLDKTTNLRLGKTTAGSSVESSCYAASHLASEQTLSLSFQFT